MRKLFLVSLCCLVVAACNHRDTRHVLPNGYSLFSPHSQNYAVSDPSSRVVVLPRIIRLGWNDSIVFGERNISDTYKYHPSERDGGFFFIIETQTDTVTFFASEKEFAAALTAFKINDWPSSARWENHYDK